MPSLRPAAHPTPTSYVKFSNKLEDSLNDIASIVQQHRQMIDSIQEVALELTTAIGSLHGITVKYARTANQILDLILPIIQNLPLIPKVHATCSTTWKNGLRTLLIMNPKLQPQSPTCAAVYRMET